MTSTAPAHRGAGGSEMSSCVVCGRRLSRRTDRRANQHQRPAVLDGGRLGWGQTDRPPGDELAWTPVGRQWQATVSRLSRYTGAHTEAAAAAAH